MTPANCFMWLVSLRKTEAGLRRRNDGPLQVARLGKKVERRHTAKGEKSRRNS